MKVSLINHPGNSSKFHVETKRGEFTLAISFTLRTKIWGLADIDAAVRAAQELAEAIVFSHNPSLPFKPLYIFAEHNSDPDLTKTIQQIRNHGLRHDVV